MGWPLKTLVTEGEDGTLFGEGLCLNVGYSGGRVMKGTTGG